MVKLLFMILTRQPALEKPLINIEHWALTFFELQDNEVYLKV